MPKKYDMAAWWKNIRNFEQKAVFFLPLKEATV